MPDPAQIVSSLCRIANEARPVAVLFHVVLLVVSFAVGVGWRPQRRRAALLLTLPLVLVGVISFVFLNPFNGYVFIASAAGLVTLGLRLPVVPVQHGSRFAVTVGALMLVFGSIYPHFVVAESPIAYVYLAPTGTIPCPTLAVVIGFALLANGLGSRAWSTTVSSLGLFYGMFGVLCLGVILDVGLVFGAAALLVVSWSPRVASSGLDRRHASCTP